MQDNNFEQFKSLEKYMDAQFGALKESIAGVNKQLEKINGRVGRHDDQIAGLKGHYLSRRDECPFREDIETLSDSFLKDTGLAEYIKQQDHKREKEMERKHRSLKTTIAIMGFIITLATFFINYLF